jgi:hypothetical protein
MGLTPSSKKKKKEVSNVCTCVWRGLDLCDALGHCHCLAFRGERTVLIVQVQRCRSRVMEVVIIRGEGKRRRGGGVMSVRMLS